MSEGTVVEASRENFHELVAQGLTLVDVWGPLCRPCLALMPHVARLAEEHPELQVVKLEAPQARRLCIELRVHGLPTFLLMREGQEVGRLSAATISPAQLRGWLEEQLTHLGEGEEVK
jgi:thioredoxin-like negative regulator of GroEL